MHFLWNDVEKSCCNFIFPRFVPKPLYVSRIHKIYTWRKASIIWRNKNKDLDGRLCVYAYLHGFHELKHLNFHLHSHFYRNPRSKSKLHLSSGLLHYSIDLYSPVAFIAHIWMILICDKKYMRVSNNWLLVFIKSLIIKVWFPVGTSTMVWIDLHCSRTSHDNISFKIRFKNPFHFTSSKLINIRICYYKFVILHIFYIAFGVYDILRQMYLESVDIVYPADDLHEQNISISKNQILFITLASPL